MKKFSLVLGDMDIVESQSGENSLAEKPNIPGIIRKLDDVVINRIAAGEVVQRPANALKELLENSLDAGAKNIQIIVKSGGLKSLQIQDDGCGIRKEDLTIVCERFTTSKLEKFEDLQQISTYGFRGEALASISHVAHLRIISKTEDSQCAYRAEYTDGGLTITDPGVPNPRACAGKQGTMITAEDLFFNMETRRRALKATSEEHNKIVDVVTRYAIHNPTVGISLKKQGELNNELRTPPNSTTLDNIRILFGVQIARELIPVTCEDGATQFSMNGYVSNANYSVKKPTFLLFINNRLVESSVLKRGIDSIYGAYLPKGTHPFLYLSLLIDPRNVDVNVHPTKYEVQFLHEDMITTAVANAVEKVLLGSNQSRTFFVQSLLPGAPGPSTSTAVEVNRNKRKEQAVPLAEGGTLSNVDSQSLQAKNMVRTDPKMQKLDKYLTSTPNPNQSAFISFQDSPSGLDISGINSTTLIPIVPSNESIVIAPASPVGSKGSVTSTTKRREIKLKSVANLKRKIEKDCHNSLLEVFRNFTFVGSVDRTLSLIQHDTRLYMVNNFRISVELFYQKMVHEFGNFGRINISEPIFIEELVSPVLDDSGFAEGPDSKEEMTNAIKQKLLDKSDMLDDYFALKFDKSGRLLSIPLLLKNYFPCMEGIPQYLVDLANKVDWKDEQKCFETFCHQTALFYAVQTGDDNLNDEIALNGHSWKWTIEHVLYPEIKKSFLPPFIFAEDSTVIQLANLPDLYKVFERC